MHCPDFIRIQMKKYNWGLVDFIYIRTSPNHLCIRKIFVITENGKKIEVEFSPCKEMKDLEKKYQRLFYIRNQIPYEPKLPSQKCCEAIKELNRIAKVNNVEIIVHYGMEKVIKEYYYDINVPDYGIEAFTEIDTVNSNEPVYNYFLQLIELL